LDQELYAQFVRWSRFSPEDSYQRILQKQVPKLPKFDKSHFARTITLLRKAGVSSEEIVGSPVWTTAPVEWHVCPRGLRKEGLWPAGKPAPANVDELLESHGRQILKRLVPELGIGKDDFTSIVLTLWDRGVPFEPGTLPYGVNYVEVEREILFIKGSPMFASAPVIWSNRVSRLVRHKIKAIRDARINRE